jgi:predicted RNA binding protein YcfA (HicA-like mRNA interferase family)
MILQLRKPDGGTLTVPVPDHRELKTGTLLGIIEQSTLPRALFEVAE